MTQWNRRSLKGYVQVNFAIIMNSFYTIKRLQEVEIKFFSLCRGEEEYFSYNLEYICMLMLKYYTDIYLYIHGLPIC